MKSAFPRPRTASSLGFGASARAPSRPSTASSLGQFGLGLGAMRPSPRLASYDLFPRPRHQAPGVPSPRPLPSALDQLGLGLLVLASDLLATSSLELPRLSRLLPAPVMASALALGLVRPPHSASAALLGLSAPAAPLGLSSRLCSRTSQLPSSRRPREASPSSPDTFVPCLRASRLPLSLSPAKTSAFQGSLPSLVLRPGCLDRLSAPNPRLRAPSRPPPASLDSSPGPLHPSSVKPRGSPGPLGFLSIRLLALAAPGTICVRLGPVQGPPRMASDRFPSASGDRRPLGSDPVSSSSRTHREARDARYSSLPR